MAPEVSNFCNWEGALNGDFIDLWRPLWELGVYSPPSFIRSPGHWCTNSTCRNHFTSSQRDSSCTSKRGNCVGQKQSGHSPWERCAVRGNTTFHRKHVSCWGARVQMKMKHPDIENMQTVQACQLSIKHHSPSLLPPGMLCPVLNSNQDSLMSKADNVERQKSSDLDSGTV